MVPKLISLLLAVSTANIIDFDQFQVPELTLARLYMFSFQDSDFGEELDHAVTNFHL